MTNFKVSKLCDGKNTCHVVKHNHSKYSPRLFLNQNVYISSTPNITIFI